MMSEHLAAMNERLTQQKDEIDILKYQLEQQQQQQGSKVTRCFSSFCEIEVFCALFEGVRQ